MNWFFRKREPKIDPVALASKAEVSLLTTKSQQPHVNCLSKYLETRKNQNGFGDDFEYTLRPKDIPRRA